jgi:hypothetical protein
MPLFPSAYHAWELPQEAFTGAQARMGWYKSPVLAQARTGTPRFSEPVNQNRSKRMARLTSSMSWVTGISRGQASVQL